LAEKKGIRVNALAKEIGVESKAILARLKDEGLSSAAPNHMSTISLGLAETVREWFAGQGGGVAVAAPPATETKAKVAPAKVSKKKPSAVSPDGGDDGDGQSGDGQTTAAAADDAPTPSTAPVAEAPAAAPVVEAPVPVEPIAPAAAPAPAVDAPVSPPAVVATPQVVVQPPVSPAVEAPAAPAPEPTTEPLRPAATTAPVAPPAAAPRPVAPAAGVVPPEIRPPVQRPTITLDSIRQQQAARAGQPGGAPVMRGPVTVAPRLTTLKPAEIQGPRVIREEKPDMVPAPRPRRPLGQPGGPGPGAPAGHAGLGTARPTTGRGVKVNEEEEAELAKKAGGAAAAKKGPGSNSTRRRGVDGRRGEANEKLKEFSEADIIARRDALNAARTTRAAVDRHLQQVQNRGKHVQGKTAAQRGEAIELEEPISVKSLSAATGIKSNDLLKKLMQQGVFANINQTLDVEVAQAIALEFGIEVQVARQETLEEELVREFDERAIDQAALARRPPVVTILGHVDHGKTSLLDKIRNANVAAGEAGGITQHTAAWMVSITGGDGTEKRVTFIDTPGHQAFTAMRARGANMTDVVVLVVSAAEGVQPQTVESINHAKAAEVPIVVALNKIDRPDANPDMVLGQLAQNGLNPVEWGGDTEVVRTSATTGVGIKELIEILDYQSELLDLKADAAADARGSVIESRIDPGLGSVATVLVQDGTLHVGDVILSGPGYGRIRSLVNDRGESIQEAGPSTPVIVSGLDELPGAGDKFFVLDDLDRARSVAEERATLSRATQLGAYNKVSLSNLFDTMKQGDIRTINLIIKADVQGSIETLSKTVTDVNTSEVRVKVIHAAVGGITESDVELADASSAVIIGFHVVPDESARSMAEARRVEVRTYRVIYEIFDDLKKALSGLLEPEVREKHHGFVEVRQVFKVSKIGNIAGCMVTDGHVQRGSKIRLTRDGRVVVEDLTIDTLRRVKEDVREVKQGFECGIKLAGYDDIKVGDRFEAYIKETFQRTL